MPPDGGPRAHRRLGATLYNARMNRLPIALLLALACSMPTTPAMAGVPSTPSAAGSAIDRGTAPPTPPADAAQVAPPVATPMVAPPTIAPATSPAVIPADAPASAQDPASATKQDRRTQAEKDYDALYGTPGQQYNPVADPTLPTPVEQQASYDPWEPMNRRLHTFNNVVDRVIAKPLAKAYVKIVPRPVRLGVGNFYSNLGQPISALNSLLQGKPRQAAQAVGRFALNTTLGWGGLFDPASQVNLPNHSEDFGQTLGTWGWKRSRYVELPLFGPRTVRDILGLIGDAPFSPMRQIQDDPTRNFLQGLQLVDIRTQLFAVDSMREGATDDYALVRDAWLQRRSYQIFGDRQLQQQDNTLPPYLRDDQNDPIVPADAMPGIQVVP